MNYRQQQQQTPLQLPSREAVTGHQLDCLLGIIHTLRPFLMDEGNFRIFDAVQEKRPELDGGAQASAVATFCNVCQRIDDMVSDKARWGTQTHDVLYENIQKHYESQIEFTKAQTEAAKGLVRPSFQLKPTLGVIPQGFVAYYGDLSKEAGAIIGIGGTPEEALADFDAAFKRTPAEQLRLVVETESLPAKIEPTEDDTLDKLMNPGEDVPPAEPPTDKPKRKRKK